MGLRHCGSAHPFCARPNAPVTELNLRACNIGDAGARAVHALFLGQSALETLDVSDNAISVEASPLARLSSAPCPLAPQVLRSHAAF